MSNNQPVSIDLHALESVTGGTTSLDQLSLALKSITSSLNQLNNLANSNNGNSLMMLIPILMMTQNRGGCCYSSYGGYPGYYGGGYYGGYRYGYW